VLDDVARRVPMGFSHDKDVIILLGETRAELSGSEWAWVMHGHLGGQPPQVDLAREQVLAAVIQEAARVEHLSSAHDLSEGGLAQALVECCLRRGLGARIALPEDAHPFVYLFSESTGRALVSVRRGHEKAFAALCDEYGLPWTAVGVVDAVGGELEVRDQFTIPLYDLRAAWSGTLPALFDPGAAAAAAVADDRPAEPALSDDRPAEVPPASGDQPEPTA